jgi:hypothetical protein
MAIVHHVLHLAQGEQPLCWAAALAMVRGIENPEAIGALVRAAQEAGVITNPDGSLELIHVPLAASAAGLLCLPFPASTVDGLKRALARGPAALFVTVRLEKALEVGRRNHVWVVSGIRDDAPGGPVLILDDPARGPCEVRLDDFFGGTVERFDYVVSR